MCRDGSRHSDIKDLDREVFKKLTSLFPTLLSAYLYGIGEVLTYPHLPDMMDTLFEYDVNVGLISNGLLIKQAMAEAWVQKGLYKLSISIDGACKETYERIRRGASFELLLKNLEMIKAIKSTYNVSRPVLTFNYVVMRDSIAELPDLVDMAAHFGAEEVIANDLIVFFDEMKEQALTHSDPLCLRYFQEAEERAHAQGVRLYLPCAYRFQRENVKARAAAPSKTEPKINPCTEPWSGFWLTGEGIVTPCCYWMKPMGDLKKDDFLTIWNNTEYQSLRRVINTAERAPHCRTCAIAGMERR